MLANKYFYLITIWLAIGTFAIRYSIIALSGRLKISARVQEILSFIPAAILPAMLVPMVYFHQGHVPWAMGKERMLVLAVATVISYKTKNMLATISSGLILLYIITQV